MKFVLRLTLLFTVGFFLFGTAKAQSDEEQIKSTLVAMWDAIEKGDVDKYASFVHPDFSAFGEYDTYISEGKTLEVEGVRSWVERSEGIHTDMHQPKVTVYGNTGWITYYWTDSGVTDGKRFSSRGKSTRIFVKEDGKWLCIHGHYTAVL